MKKTTEELIKIFENDTNLDFFKIIDSNKLIYNDTRNNDIGIIILGLDGRIFKILREVNFRKWGNNGQLHNKRNKEC